jgi:outer membrane protein
MNKKIVFTFVALFLCFSATAQIEKGKILASGSLGFASSKYKEVDNGTTDYESNSTYFWFMPKGGYFITNAIVVGVGLNLSTGSTKFEDDDKFISSTLAFTSFARYYLPQGYFGQFEFGPGSTSETWKSSGSEDSKDKYKSFLWSLGVGYAFFLNDHVSVEPMVSYSSTTYTDTDNTSYKEKNGAILFQIGFNIYLDAP